MGCMTVIITIGQAATILHRSVPTLRRWDSNGVLKPLTRLPNGERLYDRNQVLELARQRTNTETSA
jgi:DNA-binding transcriptional MerR regulator